MPFRISTLLAALTCTIVSMPAHAGRLQDGRYMCGLSPTILLGSIWITGNRYVGPSHDPNGPAHPFEVTPSGTINWGAPLGGLDSGGNRVVGTVIRDAGNGRSGFDIQIQTASGRTQVASCVPQF